MIATARPLRRDGGAREHARARLRAGRPEPPGRSPARRMAGRRHPGRALSRRPPTRAGSSTTPYTDEIGLDVACSRSPTRPSGRPSSPRAPVRRRGREAPLARSTPGHRGAVAAADRVRPDPSGSPFGSTSLLGAQRRASARSGCSCPPHWSRSLLVPVALLVHRCGLAPRAEGGRRVAAVLHLELEPVVGQLEPARGGRSSGRCVSRSRARAGAATRPSPRPGERWPRAGRPRSRRSRASPRRGRGRRHGPAPRSPRTGRCRPSRRASRRRLTRKPKAWIVVVINRHRRHLEPGRRVNGTRAVLATPRRRDRTCPPPEHAPGRGGVARGPPGGSQSSGFGIRLAGTVDARPTPRGRDRPSGRGAVRDRDRLDVGHGSRSRSLASTPGPQSSSKRPGPSTR